MKPVLQPQHTHRMLQFLNEASDDVRSHKGFQTRHRNLDGAASDRLAGGESNGVVLTTKFAPDRSKPVARRCVAVFGMYLCCCVCRLYSVCCAWSAVLCHFKFAANLWRFRREINVLEVLGLSGADASDAGVCRTRTNTIVMPSLQHTGIITDVDVPSVVYPLLSRAHVRAAVQGFTPVLVERRRMYVRALVTPMRWFCGTHSVPRPRGVRCVQ